MNKLKDIVKNSNSRMMVVTFVKADGTTRTMYCKKGVKRFKPQTSKRTYIKVASRKGVKIRGYKVKDLDIVRVFDCEKKEYRCFKMSTVVRLTCGNKLWSVENA